MKKNRDYGLLGKNGLYKMIKIMRFTIFILFLSLSQTFAMNSYSQQAKLSLDMRNARLEDVIDKIEKNSEFFFMYNKRMIDVDRKVDIQVEEKSVNEVLDKIFANTDISYSIKNRQILLINKDMTGTGNESIYQRQKSVTGKVTDLSGEPLPGVSVVLKGSTTGVITDTDGKFSLSKVSDDAVIVFSFVGMKTKEITVDGKNNINVTLEDQTIGLEEVVAVGYGTQSKRYVTGSLNKVDVKQLENSANTNINQALRGRVAGVQFIDNSRPGQNGSILIRGQRSIKASNDPLIVVDGIIFNGNFLDINQNDVEEMNVLKDASATAIYGSRAANGVILISTKRGKSDKPLIRFNVSGGLLDWAFTPDILSPDQYIQKTLDYRKQNGQEADPAKVASYLTGPEAENYKSGRTINPFDVVSQQGSSQNYDISISGKTANTNYFISGLYSKENGIIINDNARRIALRFNFESKITDWLKTGITSQFSKRDISGIRADFGSMHRISPFSQLYLDADKTKYKLYPVDDSIISNPLFETVLQKRSEIYYNLLANFYAIVDIPFIKGLSYRLNYSPNYRWDHNYYFSPIYKEQGLNRTGEAKKFNSGQIDWTIENIVDFNRTFGKHNIAATLMYSASANNRENTTASGTNMYNDSNGWDNIGISSVQSSSSSASASSSVSMMARLNYRFMERYMLTLTARRDGYSGFGANNKYGNFPSAALSWIASEEPIIKNIRVIDLLKFRLSYGKTGNQAISPYQSLDMTGTTYYVYGDGGSTVVGTYPARMGNSELAWESTAATNLAVDFEVLKHRLGGSIEIYNLQTTNLLMDQALPSMTGFSTVTANVGETNNKGIEVTLNSVNIKTPKFEWTTDLVFSANRNKIVHLTGADADRNGIEDDNIANSWFIGKPIRVAYDYIFNGIYQEGDTDIPAGWSPGYVRVKTFNADGKVTPTDRRVIGQLDPKYRWSLNNTFRYRNWTLSVFVNSMQGWISPFEIKPYYPGRPLSFFDVGYWTVENKSNTRPSLVYTNPLGQSFYISRNFVRIQDVSLSYTFNPKVLSSLNISNLKAFASVKNLYTFTDWPGYDPETGSQAGGYPLSRTIMTGVSISF